jgi:hypothetical protein
MLYYSHFVIASSLTTFRFVTDLQLLYLDAVDNFLNHGSLDRRSPKHDAVEHASLDHGRLDPEVPDLEPLDLKSVDLEPVRLEAAGPEEPVGPELTGPRSLDHGFIDHPPVSVPAPIDQDNFAAAVMPVMLEPRLAVIDGGKIDGGKSDSLDGPRHEGELDTIRSRRTDAPVSDEPDEQDGWRQTGQQTAKRESGWINKTAATAATVVTVAAGAALFEAALLPGLALGVAAIAAPKYASRLARAITPMFKSTVRATYKLARKPGEAFAEAQHQINDIIAQVRAEDASHAGTRVAEELRAAA